MRRFKGEWEMIDITCEFCNSPDDFKDKYLEKLAQANELKRHGFHTKNSPYRRLVRHIMKNDSDFQIDGDLPDLLSKYLRFKFDEMNLYRNYGRPFKGYNVLYYRTLYPNDRWSSEMAIRVRDIPCCAQLRYLQLNLFSRVKNDVIESLPLTRVFE
jgi:hypothetical protein